MKPIEHRLRTRIDELLDRAADDQATITALRSQLKAAVKEARRSPATIDRELQRRAEKAEIRVRLLETDGATLRRALARARRRIATLESHLEAGTRHAA